MPESAASPPTSQAHLEETIQAIERLQAEHDSSGTRHHRAVESITSLLGRPGFILALMLLAVAWMGLNEFASALGYRPWDSPPFPWLANFASMASLYLVVLILTTQKRDDLLARRRELLTLELAVLAEQKSAKAIALLEELRRDIPHVHDRVDSQADHMARAADRRLVFDAIREARAGAARPSRGANGP